MTTGMKLVVVRDKCSIRAFIVDADDPEINIEILTMKIFSDSPDQELMSQFASLAKFAAVKFLCDMGCTDIQEVPVNKLDS